MSVFNRDLHLQRSACSSTHTLTRQTAQDLLAMNKILDKLMISFSCLSLDQGLKTTAFFNMEVVKMEM